MAINVQEHELVPKHEIMDASEKKKLLKQLKADEEALPKILDSDPAIKSLGAKPGDIIKITRKSSTAGVALYYRLVIKS